MVVSRGRGLEIHNLGALRLWLGRTLGEAGSTNARPARLHAAAEATGRPCEPFRVGSSPWGATEEALAPI